MAIRAQGRPAAVVSTFTHFVVRTSPASLHRVFIGFILAAATTPPSPDTIAASATTITSATNVRPTPIVAPETFVAPAASVKDDTRVAPASSVTADPSVAHVSIVEARAPIVVHDLSVASAFLATVTAISTVLCPGARVPQVPNEGVALIPHVG